MLRRELERLLAAEPFEPFRIKLVNGDHHDVFYPLNVAIMTWNVSITPPDQNWVVFSLGKIASLESLIADFRGEIDRHAAPNSPANPEPA